MFLLGSVYVSDAPKVLQPKQSEMATKFSEHPKMCSAEMAKVDSLTKNLIFSIKIIILLRQM